jgi:hypothetical protein
VQTSLEKEKKNCHNFDCRDSDGQILDSVP